MHANEIHDTFNDRYYEESPSLYPQLNARRHEVEGNLLLAYQLYSGVMLPFNGTTNTTPDERKSDRINQRSLVDCILRLCLNVVEVEIGGKKFEHRMLSLSIEK